MSKMSLGSEQSKSPVNPIPPGQMGERRPSDQTFYIHEYDENGVPQYLPIDILCDIEALGEFTADYPLASGTKWRSIVDTGDRFTVRLNEGEYPRLYDIRGPLELEEAKAAWDVANFDQKRFLMHYRPYIAFEAMGLKSNADKLKLAEDLINQHPELINSPSMIPVYLLALLNSEKPLRQTSVIWDSGRESDVSFDVDITWYGDMQEYSQHHDLSRVVVEPVPSYLQGSAERKEIGFPFGIPNKNIPVQWIESMGNKNSDVRDAFNRRFQRDRSNYVDVAYLSESDLKNIVYRKCMSSISVGFRSFLRSGGEAFTDSQEWTGKDLEIYSLIEAYVESQNTDSNRIYSLFKMEEVPGMGVFVDLSGISGFRSPEL